MTSSQTGKEFSGNTHSPPRGVVATMSDRQSETEATIATKMSENAPTPMPKTVGEGGPRSLSTVTETMATTEGLETPPSHQGGEGGSRSLPIMTETMAATEGLETPPPQQGGEGVRTSLSPEKRLQERSPLSTPIPGGPPPQPRGGTPPMLKFQS